MAELEERKVIVRRKEPTSTVVPNIIFAVCMVLFIVFIFWQFGMRGEPSLGVTQNAKESAVSTPTAVPN